MAELSKENAVVWTEQELPTGPVKKRAVRKPKVPPTKSRQLEIKCGIVARLVKEVPNQGHYVLGSNLDQQLSGLPWFEC